MDPDLKPALQEIVADLEKTVPYAAALYKESAGLRINVNRMQESIEPADPARGLVFTLWNGQRFFEYAANRWEWTTLRAELKRLAERARDGLDPNRPTDDIDPGPPVIRDFSGPCDAPPEETPVGEKVEMARASLRAALEADKAVANAFSVLGHTRTSDVFVNRTKAMSQNIVRSDAMMMLFVSDGNHTIEIFHGASKNGGLNPVLFGTDEIRALVADGKRLLPAGRLKPGVYDVVTDPEWSGIIAHECFGHGMETDLYVRDRALSRRYLGKPIASPLVNMFDDPSEIGEAGGFFFDDEGAMATATHIIHDGVLQRGLTDLTSAHKLRFPRSANGRRESYARKAYARMTNTFFENGKSAPAEIIGSVENGLYLRYATNGMEDPQAWGIQVEGLWAEEIRNGKLTGVVHSPVIMTGFVPDLLKSISMVGNDRHISGLGMCGKGHKEWVKNTTGGPHLKMRARLA